MSHRETARQKTLLERSLTAMSLLFEGPDEWWVHSSQGNTADEHMLFQLTKKPAADLVDGSSKWRYVGGDDNQLDLVQMLHAHEPNVLSALRKRHLAREPYTRVGVRGVLISVNPFQTLDIYGEEQMHEYYKSADAVQTSLLKPHIFAVASEALRSLRDDRVSQSIVTSGESGAGKVSRAHWPHLCPSRHLAWPSVPCPHPFRRRLPR